MPIDLQLTVAEEAFRHEAREWLEGHVPSEPLESWDTPAGFEAHREWERTLSRDRWSVITWPEEYGGRSASIVEWLLWEEEYHRLRAPERLSQNGVNLLGPVLFAHGSPSQRSRLLPEMASGATIWAQAWSEPEAGSDLAAIRSTARPLGDGRWALRGIKSWSSRGAFADWAYGLFRTGSVEERHRGLTFFLFPLDDPRVDRRPVRRLDGDTGFAELALDDVIVGEENMIGTPGSGWAIAMSTAGEERGVKLRSPGRMNALAQDLLDLCEARDADAQLRLEVLEIALDVAAYEAFVWNVVGRRLAGEHLDDLASVNKLWWTETEVRATELALRILETEALVDSTAQTGRPDAGWPYRAMGALAGPIYAGTNEIQRNLVSERILGLPR